MEEKIREIVRQVAKGYDADDATLDIMEVIKNSLRATTGITKLDAEISKGIIAQLEEDNRHKMRVIENLSEFIRRVGTVNQIAPQ